MERPAPRLLGYAARRLDADLNQLHDRGLPEHVVRCSNATGCDMDEPPGLDVFDDWYTNHGLLTSEEMLLNHMATLTDLSTGAPPFSLFAYFVHPVWFGKEGVQEGFHACLAEAVPATPPSEAFQRVGFDLLQVEWYANVRYIGCSPLLCNGYYSEFPVNEECLLDTFEQAFEAGIHFGATQPEPGDYLVIEVWRKRD